MDFEKIWCEGTPLPSCVLDRYGNVVCVNQEWTEFLGYSSDDVIGMPISDYVDPQSRAMMRDILDPARQVDMDIRGCPIQFISLNGTTRNVLLTSRLVTDANGEQYRHEILIDSRQEDELIGRVIRTQRNLERSRQDFDEFINAAAHDLKSPIRTISAFTDLLQSSLKEKDLSEEDQENLKFVVEASHRLLALVNAVFDYNEQSDTDESIHATSVRSLIQDAASLLGFQGRILYHNELPEVNVRPEQMLRVFINLIDNAQKYAFPGRSIQLDVRSYQTEMGWVIAIQDNGIGIEKENLDTVFRMFHRVDPSAEGSGIGLSVCRKIVENHGGKIWVESEGTGRGSTFYLALSHRL